MIPAAREVHSADRLVAFAQVEAQEMVEPRVDYPSPLAGGLVAYSGLLADLVAESHDLDYWLANSRAASVCGAVVVQPELAGHVRLLRLELAQLVVVAVAAVAAAAVDAHGLRLVLEPALGHVAVPVDVEPADSVCT